MGVRFSAFGSPLLAAVILTALAITALAAPARPAGASTMRAEAVAAAVTLPAAQPVPPRDEPPPAVAPLAIDGTPPTVAGPVQSILAGRAFSRLPVKASWSASDTAGVAEYQLRLLTYPGPTITPISLPSPLTTSATVGLAVGHDYRLSVRAIDGYGNVSAWRNGPLIKPRKVEQSSSLVHYSGAWKSVASGGPAGGSYRITTNAAARVAFRFSGSAIGAVVWTAPGYGRFKVFIDNVSRGLVDLNTAVAHNRYIAFAQDLAPGTHTIRLLNWGGKVAIDAFAWEAR